MNNNNTLTQINNAITMLEDLRATLILQDHSYGHKPEMVKKMIVELAWMYRDLQQAWELTR